VNIEENKPVEIRRAEGTAVRKFAATRTTAPGLASRRHLAQILRVRRKRNLYSWGMAFSDWKPRVHDAPSPTRRGETTTAAIHTAVGFALSQWEHSESGLARLFQLLCGSPTAAAARAYGMLESSFSKAQFLRAATDSFFRDRNADDSDLHGELRALLSAYQKAQEFRNNIAHGMAVQFGLQDGTLSGYFLLPPVYATKKVVKPKSSGIWVLNAAYWCKADDIMFYAERFVALLAETMRLIQDVNKKYKVLANTQFRL
jgi:hypothetical protein